MIEVIISAVMVALIALATLGGYAAIAGVTGDQNMHAQADALAQQDQARLRGLTLTALAGSAGNQTSTPTVDNTVFTVVSSSKFVSGAGSQSCSSSGTASADEVQTTSTVSWSHNSGGHGAVVINGLVAPQEGGSLVARVTDQNGNPLTGATITLSGGPTVVSPLTTDASGCAVFGGLDGGSYTVTEVLNGFVTANNATSATTTATVVPTQTATANFTMAQGGGVSATFSTTYGGTSHASSADQIVAWTSTNPTQYNIFGTASTLGSNTYASPVATGPNSLYPGTYTVFAGACSGDNSTGGSATATVTGGSTSSVSLPLPAMIVNVWGSGPTAYDNSALAYAKGSAGSSGWLTSSGIPGDMGGDETASSTTGNTATISFSGTSVQWIGPTSSGGGYANVYLTGTLVASNVSTYSSTTAYQQVLYSATGLSAGSHTLQIVVDGTHATGSSGNKVSVDTIIAGTPALLSTAPLVTITDNNTGCSGENYPATLVPTTTQGALADPGQPYGNFTVCASSGGSKNTATVANTSYSAGNTVAIYLATGSSGLASGSCT